MQSSRPIHPSPHISYWLPVLTPELSPMDLDIPTFSRSVQDLKNFNTPPGSPSLARELPELEFDALRRFDSPVDDSDEESKRASSSTYLLATPAHDHTPFSELLGMDVDEEQRNIWRQFAMLEESRSPSPGKTLIISP